MVSLFDLELFSLIVKWSNFYNIFPFCNCLILLKEKRLPFADNIFCHQFSTVKATSCNHFFQRPQLLNIAVEKPLVNVISRGVLFWFLKVFALSGLYLKYLDTLLL